MAQYYSTVRRSAVEANMPKQQHHCQWNIDAKV